MVSPPPPAPPASSPACHIASCLGLSWTYSTWIPIFFFFSSMDIDAPTLTCVFVGALAACPASESSFSLSLSPEAPRVTLPSGGGAEGVDFWAAKEAARWKLFRAPDGAAREDPEVALTSSVVDAYFL